MDAEVQLKERQLREAGARAVLAAPISSAESLSEAERHLVRQLRTLPHEMRSMLVGLVDRAVADAALKGEIEQRPDRRLRLVVTDGRSDEVNRE